VIRIGSGHDTHRLEAGYPLILGGMRIAFEKGLAGHSDADVVYHALTDALLGALALGDIGELFPDTDAQYHRADSKIFVQAAMHEVTGRGWRLLNTDITIFAQAPKLGPLKLSIRQSIADALAVPLDAVSVKAKTGECVGHIGRGEAIGCHAVVLIEQMPNHTPGQPAP